MARWNPLSQNTCQSRYRAALSDSGASVFTCVTACRANTPSGSPEGQHSLWTGKWGGEPGRSGPDDAAYAEALHRLEPGREATG